MKRNPGSWKRWVSGLLAAAMLLGVLPFAALAEETLPAETAAMEEQTAPTTEATEEPTEATEEPTEATETPTETTEAPTETTEEPAGEVPVPLSDPAAPWDTDGDGVLEILAIGNSFSVDALEYAYRIAADLGIESIALGNLYIGGCSLATHIANANGDKGAYTYYYNDSDSWTTTKSYKISTALADRTWDYVTLQQRSPDSGLESTYNEDLTDLIAYVKERSDAKLAWHMTWAYQGDSTHSGFANYGNDQMTMYNGIVTAAQNRILTNGAFSFVIPCGTAVQNSRTSLLGDTTTRDGYHMSYAYGRYLTGLMYIRTLTGLDISGISYAPSGVDDQQKAIAIESVNNAAKTPFAVTESKYILQEPGEGYVRLELQLTKGAFWHPLKENQYNVLIPDAANSNQFFATARFTREQLPVGSVILLESGWQYRPDGWVTDELQTGTREETTTRNYILVTEDWWKDYTLRSFNLSKVGNPSLEAVAPETAGEALRIFVPEVKEEESISSPGKRVSILSHSASTYAGVSNDTSANSTIGNNDVYYTQGRHGVYREDTWWQQAMDALGMELLVNNSWSGSCIFQPRKGAASVGYGDRAVNLHNDHTGEEPEIIWVYLGCNDFAYYQDSFGKAADVNYADLIQENTDGSVSYAAPTTACEAYAIMLHKIRTRYPQAKIYCMTSTARRDPDYSGDSYPDVGQPTAFVAQLHQIAQHYGCPIIDLEQVIPKDAAVFDTLMGDKRAHPNALGMDRITNALLSVMLGTQAEIRHVTSEDATVKEQAVLLGGSYYAKADLRDGESAVVIMNGEDITAQAFRDGQITIPKVTGDIEITTALRQTSLNFRWEMQDNAIVSTGEGENTPARVTGTVTEGILQTGHYRLDTPVILRHDYNWELQWQFSGNWRGAMLASQTDMGPGALYLSRTKGGQLCFGTMEGTQYHNYGVDLSALDAQMHTFRLSNRVAADGSNMVWLSLDGAEAVPMNRFFLGSVDQNRTSDWVSGRDFVLPCLGTEDYPLNDCGFEYLSVNEGSKPDTDLWSNTNLTHIVAYGQSFSTGADAPGYADPIVDGTYVLGSITGSKVGDSLKPLQMTSGSQHPIVSAANALSKLLTGTGIDTDIIAGSYGTGGKTIAQLMSEERQTQIREEEGYGYDILSSGKYGVFQESVEAVAEYARQKGQTVSCPAIVYLQGETDQNTDAQLGYPDNPQWAAYAAGGDKEKYKLYMTRLKEDMQKEVMEAYGQTEKPLFLIYQVSGTYVRTKYSAINMAQLEFAQENEDVILVQTPYFTPHYTNSHHLTVNGYRWLGEYIGRSVYTALTRQEKTWPLLPREFTVEDARTLRIALSGAENGLTIDTWTVENASNSGNLYGFYLTVNGTRVVPKSVTVEGNDILLTLPENGVSLNKAESVYVYYGGQGAKGTGNIRDNCPETGFYSYLDDSADTGTGNNQGVSYSAMDEKGNSLIGQPYPLYNWLASFCYEIEIPESPEKQPAIYHWEMQEAGLTCVSEDKNPLTLLQGSVESGVLMGVQYSVAESITLYHNRPWAIEWKAAGNGDSYGGGMLLAAADGSGSKAGGLYLPADSRGFVAWNVSGEGRNYGIKLTEKGIDTRQEHTYRIENRLAGDGTNAVYLMVDGVEMGEMNTPYSTSNSAQGEGTKNWVNGQDIYLHFLGKPTSFLLKNMKLSYLKIWEDTHTHDYTTVVTAPTCTEQGFTTHRCSICGKTYRDTYVDAKGHTWLDAGAGIRECAVCGHIEGGYRIEAPAAEVWIDGVKYAAREDKNGKFVQLERTDAKTLVTYSYNDAGASDPHTQYPTLMQVWRLTFENGAYKLAYMPEWEDLLQYAGSSIRVTGVKGIRVITGIPKALRSKLLDGSQGYTLVEYGTAVTWAADGTPMLGQENTMFNFAYRQGVADPIFADTGSTIQYTNVLVGFTDDQLGKDLIMRPYMILEDAAGERITLYGGCVQRSIGYIAAQNRDTFPQGSKADTYIEDIISKVYG